MNHASGHRVTRGYLKLDYSPAWELNDKVIDFIFFSGKASSREKKEEEEQRRREEQQRKREEEEKKKAEENAEDGSSSAEENTDQGSQDDAVQPEDPADESADEEDWIYMPDSGLMYSASQNIYWDQASGVYYVWDDAS